MLFDDEKNNIQNNNSDITIYDSIGKVLHKIASIYNKIADGQTITGSEAVLLNQIPNIERFVNIYLRVIKEADNTAELPHDLLQLINMIKNGKQ